MSRDGDGQAARARLRILEFWQHNRGPLTGSFSIIDAYLVLFGEVFPELAAQGIGYDFIPKATSANAVYAAVEQVLNIGLDTDGVPPLPQTAVAGMTYGPEKLGISLWNAVGRAQHYRQLGTRHPVIVTISDGELQSNLDAAARLAGADQLTDLLVLLDANGLQSCYPVDSVDPTLTADPDGHLPITRVWSNYGWSVHEVDGHDQPATAAALWKAMAAEQPGLVLLKTIKGNGLPEIAGKIGRYNHGVDDELHAALTATLTACASHYPATASAEGAWVHKPEPPPSTPRFRAPSFVPAPTTRTSQILKQWLEAVLAANPDTVHVINTDTTYPFDPEIEPQAARSNSPSTCVGINEIGAFNLARGISQSGGYPVYLSPSVHLECCADEFRLAGLHQDPMLVVGFNTGSYLGHWGPAYLSRRDVETYRAPGVDIFQPATTGDLATVLNALSGNARPVYLRLPHRLLDDPGQRTECVTDGLYNMPPQTQRDMDDIGDGTVILATGVAVDVALRTAQTLISHGHRCTVVNLVRLTRLPSLGLAYHLRSARRVLVLADGETTSLELAVRRHLQPDQQVSGMDLSQCPPAASEWWLRHPIDFHHHVVTTLTALSEA